MSRAIWLSEEAKAWSAFITYRNEGIRIISVRRARPNEEALYENT